MPHTRRPLRVLVVDDEAPIRLMLRTALGAEGHEVLEAGSGQDAEAQAVAGRIEFFLIDLGLPDQDGVDLIRRLRSWTQRPIIVITGRAQEAHQVRALDAGADDVITKPFRMGELHARMRAVARRSAGTEAAPAVQWRMGDLLVDVESRQVTKADQAVALSGTQWRLLEALCRRAGSVLSPQQLLREVWGPDHTAHAHYLRIYVQRLRRAIEPDPHQPVYLCTVAGVGYRLRAEPVGLAA